MKTKQQQFSMKARLTSIRYACEGVLLFFKEQHNALIHLLFTIIVIVAAFVLKVSTIEATVLALSIGFVWAAEIFNTVIEAMMDHLSPDKHPAVKYVKDVSAAAVLISALTAVVVGSIIFIPKIF
jgi:diacylglycerol kinase (ATP)